MLLRKRDFIRDNKRAALKSSTPYTKKPITIYDHIFCVSKLAKLTNVAKEEQQIQSEVFAYKVAKSNS